MARIPDDPDFNDYINELSGMDAEQFVAHLAELAMQPVNNDGADKDTDHAQLRETAQAARFYELVHDPRYILGADDTLEFCDQVLRHVNDPMGPLGQNSLGTIVQLRTDASDTPVFRAQCNMIIINEFDPETDPHIGAVRDNLEIFKNLGADPYIQLAVCSQLLGHEDTLDHPDFDAVIKTWHDRMKDLLAGRLNDGEGPPAPNDAIEQCRAVLRNPEYIPQDVLNRVNRIMKSALVAYAHIRHQQAEDEKNATHDFDIDAFLNGDDTDDADNTWSEAEDCSADYYSAVRYIAHYMDDGDPDAAFWAGWLGQHNFIYHAQDAQYDPDTAFSSIADDMAYGATPVARFYTLVNDTLAFGYAAHKIQFGKKTAPEAVHKKWKQNMDMLVRLATNSPGANGSAPKLAALRQFAREFCAQTDDQLAAIRVAAREDAQQQKMDDAAGYAAKCVGEMDFFFTTLYRDFMNGPIDAFIAAPDGSTPAEHVLGRKRYINNIVVQNAPHGSALHVMAMQYDSHLGDLCIPSLKTANIMGTDATVARTKPVFMRHFDLN